jgi:hypothetical protein
MTGHPRLGRAAAVERTESVISLLPRRRST